MNQNERVKQLIRDSWLGLGDTSKLDIQNPLSTSNYTEEDWDNPGWYFFKLMNRIEYLHYAVKVLFGITLLPYQIVILRELWRRQFPMFIASRGAGKSFLMAVYALLRMILTPKNRDGSPRVKIVIVGAAFRQSKIVFEYMENIWNNSSILRDLCDNASGCTREADKWTLKINGNWTTAIPVGTGHKIRGLRATHIISDEFSAMSIDIYETVVQNFASVAPTPVDKVRSYSERAIKQNLGIWQDKDETEFQSEGSNQIILSGTADYDFKHFADYWKKYKGIVESNNDKRKLAPWFDEEGVPEGFDSRNYSVIRLPYTMVPRGLLDDRVLTRAKATMHSGIFAMEFGCVFVKDSAGFFRRSLIESCVASERNVLKENWPTWCSTHFDATTRGNHKREYVYGIDPASEQDNFAIVVLELWPGHHRVVYGWTTNKDDFRKRQKAGLTSASDFYGFCARKIRELMRVFPLATSHPLGASIAVDAQGGGISVEEALHDIDKLLPGEQPLWPIIDPDRAADTDDESGLHCLHMVQFADFSYTSQANHGLRKDMEDKVLLFPRFDPVSLELAAAKDKIRVDKYREAHGKELTLYDSLEDCVMEVEELKDELSTIVMTRTGTSAQGRDRWDVPSVQLEGGKKGRMRKDRYSSLLMANMLARQIQRMAGPVEYEVIGGFTKDIKGKIEGPLYTGPEWFTKEINDVICAVPRRSGV